MESYDEEAMEERSKVVMRAGLLDEAWEVHDRDRILIGLE